MCNDCCKEFKGWCKSFTRTEALLSLLEAFLLVIFVVFLTFLILHFLACSKPEISSVIIPPTSTATPAPGLIPSTSSVTPHPHETPPDDGAASSTRETLSPDVKCTWKPSQKTAATTHYYENGAPTYETTTKMEKYNAAVEVGTRRPVSADDEFPAGVEDSDGEEVGEGADSFVLALVKLHPTGESTFGCVLTVVSRFWTLTAASCIEAVEEVDSLDAFVMLEGYGRAEAEAEAAHAVADVRMHPQFARAGRSRDVAALRSEDALAAARLGLPQLPTVLDHLLITIGERMTLLGYGRFRTPESRSSDRRLRAAGVYSLPRDACAGAALWAPRHLAPGAPALPATGDLEPICAGVLYSRGVPCNFCAGSPLTRARLVLGVMPAAAGPVAGGGGGCGGACEPSAFVSLAAVRGWLDDLVETIIV